MVVLPAPGPPVMTSTLEISASRMAAIWLSARESPMRCSTQGNAFSGSIRVVTFIGGTTEPDKVVERFQNDERIQFFLGNLDCASTSITLTVANHVVLAEQSWVPSDEDQAIARVWRTGQKQPVSVVKFILENSLDERIQAAQDRKREFIARVLDGEES